MPQRPMHTVTQVGVRLTRTDVDKLGLLCGHTQRSMSDVVRLLIRLAQPLDLPHVPVQFCPERETEHAYVAGT